MESRCRSWAFCWASRRVIRRSWQRQCSQCSLIRRNGWLGKHSCLQTIHTRSIGSVIYHLRIFFCSSSISLRQYSRHFSTHSGWKKRWSTSRKHPTIGTRQYEQRTASLKFKAHLLSRDKSEVGFPSGPQRQRSCRSKQMKRINLPLGNPLRAGRGHGEDVAYFR